MQKPSGVMWHGVREWEPQHVAQLFGLPLNAVSDASTALRFLSQPPSVAPALFDCHLVGNVVLVDIADVLHRFLPDVFGDHDLLTLPNHSLGLSPSATACLQQAHNPVLTGIAS